MRAKSVTGLTISAVALLFALLIMQKLQVPSPYIIVVLLLWIGSVLMFSRGVSASAHFRFWWTWRGALMWLGSILVATGIVALINWMRGVPMTWEQWSGLVTGFLLAYALGFLLYLVIARGDRRST